MGGAVLLKLKQQEQLQKDRLTCYNPQVARCFCEKADKKLDCDASYSV